MAKKANWEEVKRLAADLQRAQLSDTVQRLSDSNCIEIVNKLVGLKLLDIIYTVDGKEYLTSQEIGKEVREELAVQGGRINLVDLQTAINIDFSHIESKVHEIVRGDRSLNLVLGQLIDQHYILHLVEEINDYLQENGEVTISELTKKHDLPADFLHEIVADHLGQEILGCIDEYDNDVLFTQKFVQHHRSVVRGALCGAIQPKLVTSILSQYSLQERLFHKIVEELIAAGELCGQISGSKNSRAVYIPDIYSKAQDKWISDFLHQNGYLEYDSVSRLGITNPQTYIKKQFKSESLLYLKTCCIGKVIQENVAVLVDEALLTSSWVDLQQYLPSCVGTQDAAQIISTAIKSKPEAVLFSEAIVVSKKFIRNCQDSFAMRMDAKAEKDIQANPNLLQLSADDDHAKSVEKDDRREQRKKKQANVSKSGGGTQGREVKSKSTKNKYRAGQTGPDDEPVTKKETQLSFMTPPELEEELTTVHPSCPAELISELAAFIHRPLTVQYHEHLKRVFRQTSGMASGSGRRKIHSQLQDNIGTLWSSVKMFEKGIVNFPEDVRSFLNRHLLATLCTDISNLVFKAVALDNMVSSSEDEKLTPELRAKLLSSMSDPDTRKKLTKLNQTVNEKSVEEFCLQLEDICGPSQLGILLRKPDKKKERLILHGHRVALVKQLEAEIDPAMALHLSVVIMYQSATGCMLHAPGKCVPHIVTYLAPHLEAETHKLLAEFQARVVRHVKSGGEDGDGSSLHEQMLEIKQLAIQFKPSSKNE